MSGLSLLDIAIGMIFFFLLLSLACSAANEILAALLQTRAAFLERGLKRLLVTDEFTQTFYDHPLITSLADEVDPVFKKVQRGLPSYIPSKTFALAIVDLMKKNAVTPQTVAVPDRVYDALQTLLRDVDNDASKVRLSIEDWYNNAMDRVSGAYKRRVQYVLFALGILLAVCLNADSIAVVERLSTNKIQAAAVADAATQYAEDSNPPSVQTAPDTSATATEAAAKAQKSLQMTLGTLDKLELPIGWGESSDDTTPILKKESTRDAVWRLARIHLIGWLITGLAVSFGAPFWFDVLNKFVVVRSTIKPQEKPDTSKT